MKYKQITVAGPPVNSAPVCRFGLALAMLPVLSAGVLGLSWYGPWQQGKLAASQDIAGASSHIPGSGISAR